MINFKRIKETFQALSPRAIKDFNKHLDYYRAGVILQETKKLRVKYYREVDIDGESHIVILTDKLDNYIVLNKETYENAVAEYEYNERMQEL